MSAENLVFVCVSHELLLISPVHQPTTLFVIRASADFFGLFFSKSPAHHCGFSHIKSGWGVKRIFCLRAHVYSSAFAEQLCALEKVL